MGVEVRMAVVAGRDRMAEKEKEGNRPREIERRDVTGE